MIKRLGLILVLVTLISLGFYQWYRASQKKGVELAEKTYWFVLNRKSNKEYLYFGEEGVKENSALVKVFNVKAGIPGERPTPLPELLGKKYWEITSKIEVFDNPETAPYFLTLNIPASAEPPYGPTPYLECNGQCDWVLPGAFGLHGVNNDSSRLSEENKGSSGCVRHTDEDITYLYNLLDPQKEQVRYYIYDI